MIKMLIVAEEADKNKIETYFSTQMTKMGTKYIISMPILRTKCLKLADLSETTSATTFYINPYKDQHSKLIEDTLSGVSNIEITGHEHKILLNREGLK